MCHGALTDETDGLVCDFCCSFFPVEGGIPTFLVPEDIDEERWEMIAAWDELSKGYAPFIARVGAARLAMIDRPLLAISWGDVVEVGCGDGRLLAQLSRTAVSSVLGVDFSSGMVRAARSRGLSAIVASAERLPLADRSADTVVSGYYALRDADLDAALGEIARILRPAGRVGFTLLARRAVAVAARLRALPLLLRADSRDFGLGVLLGRDVSFVQSNDVESVAALRSMLGRHGLRASWVGATPYIPIVGGFLARATAGRVPYLREEVAARLGYDIIVIAEHVSR